MATLSPPELQEIRNRMEKKALEVGISVSWVKALVQDVAQTIEDLLSGDVPLTRTEVPASGIGLPAVLSNRIDTATQPYGVTLNANQKRYLVAYVFRVKFERDQ